MAITASKLRENVYRILDDAIETGVPVEIERKGVILRIVPDTAPSRLDRIEKRDLFEGDPDSIIGADWLAGWSERA